MNKITKTILSSVTAMTLLISSAATISANGGEVTQSKQEIGINAVIKPGKLIGLGFKVLQYGTNTWLFHPEATTYQGSTQLEVTSGKIGFNNKGDSGYGASTKHNVIVDSTDEQIQTFAETDWLNMFTSKIVLIISDPYNNDVVSKTLSHEQYVLHNPSRTGTYTIRYADESKLNWNLYIYLRNYQINPSSINVLGIDGTEVPALYKNDKIYIYPSESHTKSKFIDKLLGNTLSLNKTLSYIDLQKQIYDSELNRNVRDFKDYNIGDTIFFKDKIASIEYDPSNNRTLIGFNDQDNDIVNWVFKEDLTDRFKVGDSIKLKLKVVEEVAGFENIDLIKNFQDSEEMPENIDNYLVLE